MRLLKIKNKLIENRLFLQIKSRRILSILWVFLMIHYYSTRYFVGVVNKTIIPLALGGYEMIIATSVIHTSVAIYHLISNANSWNDKIV